jgi:hypothetical protein
LAGVLADQNRFLEAEAAYRIVSGGFARRFGDLHPETLQVRREFADVLQRVGNTREAEKQREFIRRAAKQESRLDQASKSATAHHPLNANEAFPPIWHVLRRRRPSLLRLMPSMRSRALRRITSP